jgi:hypothetical protein
MPLKANRTRWDDALARGSDRIRALARAALSPRRLDGRTRRRRRDGRSYDGGIDLKLRRGHEYVLVQCKRWNAYQVPHNDVHELVGVMVGEGATGAVLVTCGEFTRAALDAARKHPTLQLVDGAEVRRRIELPETAAPANTWDDALRSRAPAAREAPRERSRWIPAIVVACALLVLAVLFLAPKASVRRGGAPVIATPSTNIVPTNSAPVSRTPPTLPTPAAPAPPTAPVAGASAALVPAQTQTSASTPTLERAGRLKPLGQAGAEIATQFLRQTAAAPDPARPIDHENARAAARAIAGVRSAFWIDRENFVVMVDGQSHRTMAMIDAVCVALQPLGDTLAVVVNVQDVTAQRPDDATTLSRNCQLAQGESAMFRTKRQLDTVSPEVRAQFKQQQSR